MGSPFFDAERRRSSTHANRNYASPHDGVAGGGAEMLRGAELLLSRDVATEKV
jgi:hypothetical protein